MRSRNYIVFTTLPKTGNVYPHLVFASSEDEAIERALGHRREEHQVVGISTDFSTDFSTEPTMPDVVQFSALVAYRTALVKGEYVKASSL